MPTVLVIGGSGTIGSEICFAFAKQGFDIVFTYYKNKQKALQVYENLLQYCKNPPSFLQCNVEEEMSVYQCIQNGGYFECVVNAAGIELYKELQFCTDKDFQKIIANNLMSTFFITKYSAEKFRIRNIEGSILHIASIWGEVGASCESLYAATKGGVIAFTKSIAKELAPQKIRVNALSPGMIATPMNATFTHEEVNAFFQNAPIKKIGQAKDVAQAAVFLHLNKYITGEILRIDGGVSL